MTPNKQPARGIYKSGMARAVRWELHQTWQRAGHFNPDARASRLTEDGRYMTPNKQPARGIHKSGTAQAVRWELYQT